MNVKKQLWSQGHMVLSGVGFVLTCSGAYLLSLHTGHGDTWRASLAKVMIVLGLLSVLIGVFWTICHSVKTKSYQRGGHGQQIQFYTIERPSSFPPSYEESQGSQPPDTPPDFVVVVDCVDVMMTPAPPLYSQDSSGAPDCTLSWEQPPRYSQVERIQWGEVDAD